MRPFVHHLYCSNVARRLFKSILDGLSPTLNSDVTYSYLDYTSAYAVLLDQTTVNMIYVYAFCITQNDTQTPIERCTNMQSNCKQNKQHTVFIRDMPNVTRFAYHVYVLRLLYFSLLLSLLFSPFPLPPLVI